MIARRQLLAAPWLLNAASGGLPRIEHRGVLIAEAAIAGETRADDTVPAHPNGTQVSPNRWLLVYATRKFRGTDDDTSILWQLRADAPDGRLIREGLFAQSTDRWSPFGDQRLYVKQHGSPVVFGVPKGAIVAGRPAANENLFVVKWRRGARQIDHKTGVVEGANLDPDMVARTQCVEWTQVRLNRTSDDLEIVQPAQVFRQRGYESGAAFCSVEQAVFYSQEKTQAVPYNRDGTEWIDLIDTDRGFLPCRMAFDARAGRYHWVETGPLVFNLPRRLLEASLARAGNSWVIAGRTDYVEDHQKRGLRGLEWVRCEDPMRKTAPSVHSAEPPSAVPVTIYNCADGRLRFFGGAGPRSPYGNERDPLFAWEIDPDRGFRGSNPLVVFDSVKAGLPFRKAAMPKIDQCKLLPHAGGRVQYILHRVSAVSINQEHHHPREGFFNENPQPWTFPVIDERERRACAVYYARLHYPEAHPAVWSFARERGR